MRRPTLSLAGSFLLIAACGVPAPSQAPQRAQAGASTWSIPSLPAPTPISREEFAARRAAIAAAMQDGVLVVFGAQEPEADYLPFAQNVALRYLTGILEPGAALVIEKSGGEVSERLFVLPRDPAREVWEGARLGAEAAQARTGIRSRVSGALMATLDSLAARSPRLYTLNPPPPAAGGVTILSPDQQVVAALAARNPRLQVSSLAPQLERLRATKSTAELDRIRRAVYITLAAQRAAMATVEPGMNEFEIHGLIEYTFRRHGAERPSFATIVGSGPNSTTLHYRAADRFMQAGETVVMDIGASYDGYAADVTRTVPVSGTFSPEQRAVYEIVLAAQKAAENRAQIGTGWGAVTQEASRTIAEGLARLGLIEAANATYDCGGGRRCPQYQLFYMHGLGHGIGLEVHDPDITVGGTVAAGSAFTIEPGIYVRADVLDHLPDSPENRATIARLAPAVQRYRNIGVRIEDDYLVTAAGTERITAGAPREIDEIEAAMRLPAATTERSAEVVEWYRGLGPR